MIGIQVSCRWSPWRTQYSNAESISDQHDISRRVKHYNVKVKGTEQLFSSNVYKIFFTFEANLRPMNLILVKMEKLFVWDHLLLAQTSWFWHNRLQMSSHLHYARKQDWILSGCIHCQFCSFVSCPQLVPSRTKWGRRPSVPLLPLFQVLDSDWVVLLF